ncbi:DUF2971 domain-containing protein [Paenibacillus amylolyticus]|uniref:DUF2971 domain-containing protein n=1 Tax=Paenibacillus amylolyticus TaxID=1451 RepID=A0ABD8B323_PAEAM
MGYDADKWSKRMYNRSDLSDYLTHLTKPIGQLSSVDVLIKILNEGCINGSTDSGFIIGESPAVCFQDAPLYSVVQNIYHEVQNFDSLGRKKRYTANGLSFPKRDVFLRGGRPCIYEKKSVAKEMLLPSEWWRIVPFDLTWTKEIIDWSHEREWRVKGNFKFDLSETTVVLSHNSYREFVSKVGHEYLQTLGGIVVLSRLI